MSKKLDFRNMKQTQFDRGQVEKAVFSELMSAYRTTSTTPVIADAYTHFIQVLNNDGLPTQVDYYQAIHPAKDKINFSGDVGGNKAGTYFTLQEFLTKRTQVFYYVVDGNGSAPGIGDVETPIEISINDPASVVAYATKLVLDTVPEYIITQKSLLNSYLELEYLQFGETDAIDVGTTGFLATRLVEGESNHVGTILLDYDINGNPIYNGNVLKGLKFNQFTGSFDINPATIDGIDLKKGRTFKVLNVYIPLANVETEIVIPNAVKRYKIKAREPNTKIRVSDGSGDYFTIPYGAMYEDIDLDTLGVTLYVETDRDDRTIELLLWS